MGSFQITYEDFSGGQYMGPRSTNLPKNTWTGKNVMCTPDGQLMPSEPLEFARYQRGVTSNGAHISDHWIIGPNSYVFTQWGTSPGSMTLNVFGSVYNGTASPVAPTTSVVLVYAGDPLVFYGEVAFAQAPTNLFAPEFYFVDYSTGIIYSCGSYVSPGSITQVSSALTSVLAGYFVSMVLYSYRLITWGSGKRLYYSDTDLITWSLVNYYEFNSNINNVIVRTNDLLVFTDGGVYSVTGVFGS